MEGVDLNKEESKEGEDNKGKPVPPKDDFDDGFAVVTKKDRKRGGK